MSHSHHALLLHIVWATKNVAPLISPNAKPQLLRYIAGTLKNLGGSPILFSSTADHIHLLLETPSTISIAELVGKMKSSSSKWYHHQYVNSDAFGWNPGYFACTICKNSLNNVKCYLDAEDQRHDKISYADELVHFITAQEIPYKPEYLFSTTYTKLCYHLVWSVKNRALLLRDTIQNSLHQLIDKALLESGGMLHAIGNIADHIHLLVEINSSARLDEVVQKLKTTSTYLIREHTQFPTPFSWQAGYGAFGVGKSAFAAVHRYVKNQEQHHGYITPP